MIYCSRALNHALHDHICRDFFFLFLSQGSLEDVTEVLLCASPGMATWEGTTCCSL